MEFIQLIFSAFQSLFLFDISLLFFTSLIFYSLFLLFRRIFK